jgi:hypothetical protein
MPLQFITAQTKRYYYSENSGKRLYLFNLTESNEMTIQNLKRGNSAFLPTDHAVTSNFIPMEDCLK